MSEQTSKIPITSIDVVNASDSDFIDELVRRWNSHDALVKIKELGYEVACTGDQQAEEKLIGLIDDYEAAIAEARE